MEDLGPRIREIRSLLELSQKAFANGLGISAPALSDIERGVNGVSLGTFRKLVNDYRVNPYFLLNGEPPIITQKSDQEKISLKADTEGLTLGILADGLKANSSEIQELRRQFEEIRAAFRPGQPT